MDFKRPVNVLIIDDDEISNFILIKLLRKISSDIVIEICLNGELAIEHLLDLVKRDAKYPDIIFLDISMPVMNGWGFLKQYMHDGFDRILKSRIFVATSSIFQRDHNHTFSHPVVEDLIVKPFNVEGLRDILNSNLKLA